MSEQKELTLEVSAQNASFYSPGHHANPSHKWGNESQDKPGIGPGNNSKNQQEPRQPIFLLVENWGDRVFGTPNNFKTAIKIYDIQFSSVQPLSHVRLFATPWTAACQASLSITNSQSLLKLMSIESVMPSHPVSSPSPPAFNLSQHQSLFKWVSSSHQVAKVLEFHLQHQSFQWTFRTDFLWDGLVGSPCSPRDSHSSKTSILWHSAFFIVQLSHPCMTTGKTIALTRWTCWQSNVSAF